MRLVGLAMLGAIFIGEGVYLIAWVTTPVLPTLVGDWGRHYRAPHAAGDSARASVGVYRWPEHLLLRGN